MSIGKNGSVRFLHVAKNSSESVLEVREGMIGRNERLCEDHEVQGPEEELVWKISTPPPNVRYIELNSETSSDALLEVMMS
ncbi:MAG: hypothetical protein VB144_13065 [Clostridia bacterium]|nr:hypothetical protein [Clostridia bacterium]